MASKNEVRIIIKGDTKDIEKDLKRLKKDSKSTFTTMEKDVRSIDKVTRTSTQSMNQSWGRMVKGATAAAGAIFTVKKAAKEFEDAAKRATQADAFAQLAESFGVSADTLLGEMERVSKGTVTQAELIATAGKAMLIGLAPDTIVELLEVAEAAVKVTGESITKSFEDIALGTARQSKPILDNLGIILEIERAYKDYKEAIGATNRELTQEEMRLAVINQVGERGSRIVRLLSTEEETLTTTLARANAQLLNSVNNFKDAIFGNKLFALSIRFVTAQLQNTADLITEIGGFFGLYEKKTEEVKDTQHELAEQTKAFNERLAEQRAKADEARAALDALDAKPPIEAELVLEDNVEEVEEKLEEIDGTVTKSRHIIVEETTKKGSKTDTNTGGRRGTTNVLEFLLQPKAKGGKLSGYGGGDTVPIIAERGEFVARKEAVSKFGDSFFNAANNLNSAGVMKALGVQGFQGGGTVGTNNTVNVDLNLGGDTFRTTAPQSTADSFIDRINKTNLVNGRRRAMY